VSQEIGRANFELVRLPNGSHAVYSAAYAEKMHPGLGPAAEADLLYVQQLRILERMRQTEGEFVVWDVGLGAAANALAVLRATRDIPLPLRLVSFDNTTEPMAFALQHLDSLGYLRGYENQIETLLRDRTLRFTDGAHQVQWQFHLDDFPDLLERRSPIRPDSHTAARPAGPEAGPPHAILFDAFSPAKNPAMWTLPLFQHLFGVLDPQRPCNLTTYSRSTMLRVTLLLAGFLVGRGVATGVKEETTVAANHAGLIESPLDRRWLETARRSANAEPLRQTVYSQSPLSAPAWEQLLNHPQFK
jgi:queuine tRNA-ribosyltransferase